MNSNHEENLNRLRPVRSRAACLSHRQHCNRREPQLWKMTELRNPPKTTWVDKSGPLRKLYYESEPRHGRPTRVFAYCAFPEDTSAKSPGIVLIHGGGGTAFAAMG